MQLGQGPKGRSGQGGCCQCDVAASRSGGGGRETISLNAQFADCLCAHSWAKDPKGGLDREAAASAMSLPLEAEEEGEEGEGDEREDEGAEGEGDLELDTGM